MRASCNNCGRVGHVIKRCQDPITSYGLINVSVEDHDEVTLKALYQSNTCRVTSTQFPDISCDLETFTGPRCMEDWSVHCTTEAEVKRFCKLRASIKFMMVSRRQSLGYVGIVKGRYNTPQEVDHLFSQMYPSEIKSMTSLTYDQLLAVYLGPRIKDARLPEYRIARTKFNQLQLAKYESVVPEFQNPEWGFPKGRRHGTDETDFHCACREFCEETGYRRGDYEVLERVKPIQENLLGTNNVWYRHIYYLSLGSSTVQRQYTSPEIGEVRWCTYDEAYQMIRPYHEDKRRILTRVFLFLVNSLTITRDI